jgi:hypothetical protein
MTYGSPSGDFAEIDAAWGYLNEQGGFNAL